MKKNTIYLLTIISLIFFNCRKINNCDKKEKLTLLKTNFNGIQLKTNGYFYYNYDKYSVPLIFYKNGIGINYHSLTFDTTQKLNFEQSLKNGNFYNKVKDDKYAWGLYNIANDIIKYEVFTSKSALSCKYPIIYTGTIINDTTIHFTNITNSDGTESESIDETYHYKELLPKPDSTNSFIP